MQRSPTTNNDSTFGQFLAEFRTDFGGWSSNTWRGLSGMLRKLDEEFGDRPLESITPRQIDRYLTRRRSVDGVTTSTTNRYLATLKTLFKTARNWDYITDDPTSRVTMLKEQSRVPDALSDSELESLIVECRERTRQVVILAADTGMRRSEIQRLTWRDVDFEAGTVIVRQSKNKDYRVIPMTDRLRSMLAHLKPELAQPDQSVLAFGDIKRSLHSAGVRAQIGHVHLHKLRHTFATRLRDRGVPLDRIMELMGHKSMEMALRYAKARPQQLVEAIAALNTDTSSSRDALQPSGSRVGHEILRYSS